MRGDSAIGGRADPKRGRVQVRSFAANCELLPVAGTGQNRDAHIVVGGGLCGEEWHGAGEFGVGGWRDRYDQRIYNDY